MFRLIASTPLTAKLPGPRLKSTGAPTVEQAFAGGAPAGFTHKGVGSAVPTPGVRVFAALAQPVNDDELPAVASVKLSDWLAESTSGLPAGRAKLFWAKLTRSVPSTDPAFLVTAVFVSVANAKTGEPGELPVSVISDAE